MTARPPPGDEFLPPRPPGDDFHHSYSNSQDSPFPVGNGNNEVPPNQQLPTASSATMIGFQGYVVTTEEPFVGFHHIVIAYCFLAFVLMYPFVVCGRHYRENYGRNSSSSASWEQQPHKQQQEEVLVTSPPGSDLSAGHTLSQSPTTSPSQLKETSAHNHPKQPLQKPHPQEDLDPVTPTTSKSTVQDDDLQRPMSEAVPMPATTKPNTNNSHHHHHQEQRRPSSSQVASSSGISRIPSAATTGLLYSSRSARSTGAWPRHKHSRRPTGVPSWQWKRAIQSERRHRLRQLSAGSLAGSSSAWRLKSSAAVGVMSDLANSVLTAEQQEAKMPYTTTTTTNGGGSEANHSSRKNITMRQRQRRGSFNGSVRSGSVWSDYNKYPASVMSSIVDDISPNDAADADDPGKVKAFDPPPAAQPRNKTAAALAAIEPWLDVAEPNEEFRRLTGLAFPMTLGALLEPLSRCFLLAIISEWVGTHAMVAYLLVQLLYRLTGETLSVAITDAESTLVQMVLTDTSKPNPNSTASSSGGGPQQQHLTFSKEGYRQAGHYVQLACWLQLLLVGPVLVVWYFCIEDVVQWWVDSSSIASLAKEYFQVVVYLFLIQALYRAVMVPCHIRGSTHASSETILDVLTAVATLITVPLVLSQVTDQVDENNLEEGDYTPADNLDNSKTALAAVGWTQVNICAAACVMKLAFCILKGWLDHFGIVRSAAFLNFSALCNLILATIPLVIGSVLEFGEVDLLTIFVRHLGAAEVGAWAIVASIWDVLQASTEGISEAAAIRVAYHLSVSGPTAAKRLTRKVLFWTAVLSLVLSSALLLIGRNLIVTLAVDYTLQHLLDDQLGLIALANLSLGFGQVCWSLICAQGRFNLATFVVLVCRWMVTIPLALIFIYALNYDEEALSGAMAVGSSTAACFLTFVLFSSDWKEIAQDLFMKGLLSSEDDDEFDFGFGDDDESSECSSFNMGGFPLSKENQKSTEDKNAPQTTEPTARTNTGTGSHTNTGSHSGMHSGHSGMHSGHSGIHSGHSGIHSGGSADNCGNISSGLGG